MRSRLQICVLIDDCSPLRCSLCVQVGGLEVTLDDSVRFVKTARSSGNTQVNLQVPSAITITREVMSERASDTFFVVWPLVLDRCGHRCIIRFRCLRTGTRRGGWHCNKWRNG